METNPYESPKAFSVDRPFKQERAWRRKINDWLADRIALWCTGALFYTVFLSGVYLFAKLFGNPQ